MAGVKIAREFFVVECVHITENRYPSRPDEVILGSHNAAPQPICPGGARFQDVGRIALR